MKRTVGILSVLLAFLIAVNSVTPALTETIWDFFSLQPHAGSVNGDVGDYTVADDQKSNRKASDQKEVAYDDGKILIYNFDQLSKIGSGESYTYDDGVSVTYAPDAEYRLTRDIPVPRHTQWQLPEGFSGKITGGERNDAPLYDGQSDRI